MSLDFSGLWRLDLERSTLQGDQPQQVDIRIKHVEPKLVQEIHVTRADGTKSSLSFTFDTSGGETTHALGRGRARWIGAELLLESWIPAIDRELHFRDYWSLSTDGRTLTMAHRNDDLAGQTSVLERLDATSDSR